MNTGQPRIEARTTTATEQDFWHDEVSGRQVPNGRSPLHSPPTIIGSVPLGHAATKVWLDLDLMLLRHFTDLNQVVHWMCPTLFWSVPGNHFNSEVESGRSYMIILGPAQADILTETSLFIPTHHYWQGKSISIEANPLLLLKGWAIGFGRQPVARYLFARRC